MKTFTKKEFVVNLLRDIEDGGDPAQFTDDEPEGICQIIEGLFEEWNSRLLLVTRREGIEAMHCVLHWVALDYDECADPDDSDYPVPVPAEDEPNLDRPWCTSKSQAAYYSLPSWTGEYGEARRDYAGHMANWIEENL